MSAEELPDESFSIASTRKLVRGDDPRAPVLRSMFEGIIKFAILPAGAALAAVETISLIWE